MLKGLGWLITALAVSLGGPFWFQLLHRIVDLRGAGATACAHRRRAYDSAALRRTNGAASRRSFGSPAARRCRWLEYFC
jgi:hypothetical protein